MQDTNPQEIERLFQSSPFIADIGLQLDSVAPGEVCTSLILAERHLQQDGYVHAGVQATVADHTAGAAAVTLLSAHQYVLTAEFKISLLRAAKGSQLSCRAKVLKAGKILTVIESEVYCGNLHSPQLVSKAMVTVAIVASPSNQT